VAAKKDGDRQCPADLSPELHARVNAMITEAHRVLKCRHYSLYDICVDANEQPYILEAALFCSFSPLSVIPAMAQHSGREELKHPNFFHSLIERVAAEKQTEEVPKANSRSASKDVCSTSGGESDLAGGLETCDTSDSESNTESCP